MNVNIPVSLNRDMDCISNAYLQMIALRGLKGTEIYSGICSAFVFIYLCGIVGMNTI